MKTERLENTETKQDTNRFMPLEEALNAKLKRTKQVLDKLNPVAHARLKARGKQSQNDL